MKRHQQILAGILILQIILGVVTFWPRSGSAGATQPIFPDLNVEDIVTLTITDDQGAHIVLSGSGENWGLAEAGDYPVKASTITPILEKFTQLDTATLVARTTASHKVLQVADDNFVRRIDIGMKDGTTHTIYLGSSPRYTATNFRVAGQDETYLTAALSSWELSTGATSWVDTTYRTIDATTVTEVTLQNANGTFKLVKTDDDQWTLANLAEDEIIDPAATSDIVSKVTRISLQRPLGLEEDASYGFTEPTAIVTLTTDDGVIYALHVGAKFDGTNYAVKASESQYYVAVTEYNVRPLIENDRAAFMQEPTPTPTAEP
ncbi:MAG: DUF4340 domain-containing protein [Anaerolineae bacterium]|nr:DUF4340 domain-containing protein [Anaerolineae bacterium]